MNLGEVGFEFRSTKDLDIVLKIEVDTLDREFADVLWQFINDAGYTVQQKTSGEPIVKHKRDVFRLAVLLTEETSVEIPASVRNDLNNFIETVKQEPPVDLKGLNIRGFTFNELIEIIRQSFDLS